MAGLCIGLACGAGELYLLVLLTRAISAGDALKALAIVSGKVLLFAAALVPAALFFPRELIWCGIGISSVLVIGAFVINVLMRRGGKGGR